MKRRKLSDDAARALARLREHGVLLQTDANLPSISFLIAGEPVRGSWWSHPAGRAIFRVNGELEDHPDVLMAKLISGKITFIHRALWAAVLSVGRAREPWQMDRLSRGARALLAEVDRRPVKPDGRARKAASELETSLLVFSEQFHTESGAHVRRLDSWDRWSGRVGPIGKRLSIDRARLTLEDLVATLNRKFEGTGRLPWQRRART